MSIEGCIHRGDFQVRTAFLTVAPPSLLHTHYIFEAGVQVLNAAERQMMRRHENAVSYRQSTSFRSAI